MRAIATGYKKAGLPGLFLWLTLAAVASPGMAQAPSLLEQLQKGVSSPPPPPQKSTLPPLRLQIEKATPSFDKRTREPVVLFRLTERSGRMFAEFTANNIGRTVEVRIDGRVVMRPITREPIKGGSVQVSGGFTLASAQELADHLNSGAASVEAEVVD
jgi:preprotein translocase subunit SecD